MRMAFVAAWLGKRIARALGRAVAAVDRALAIEMVAKRFALWDRAQRLRKLAGEVVAWDDRGANAGPSDHGDKRRQSAGKGCG